MSLLINKFHDFSGQFNRLIRVIGNAKLDQHIRPSHHAQPYLAIRHGHLGDWR